MGTTSGTCLRVTVGTSESELSLEYDPRDRHSILIYELAHTLERDVGLALIVVRVELEEGASRGRRLGVDLLERDRVATLVRLAEGGLRPGDRRDDADAGDAHRRIARWRRALAAAARQRQRRDREGQGEAAVRPSRTMRSRRTSASGSFHAFHGVGDDTGKLQTAPPPCVICM